MNTQGNALFEPMSHMTLRDCWYASLGRFPHKDAVIDAHGVHYSYAEVDLLASRVARYLVDSGIKPHDVVSCQLPGWAEFLVIIVACLKIGAVINPIPPSLRFREVRLMLSRCQSKVLFVPRFYRKFTYCQMAALLRHAVKHVRTVVAVDKFGEGSELPTFRQIVEEDIHAPMSREETDALTAEHSVQAHSLAAIVFTSGSEGQSKGVMLSHANIIFAETSFAQFFQLDSQDIMFMPAPVTHATGLHHGVCMPFIMGGTSVLLDIFRAESALSMLAKYRCTVTMAATPFLHDMVCVLQQQSYDLSALRFYLCGGSAPNLAINHMAQDLGVKVLNVYGSTESVPHMGTPLEPVSPHMESMALLPMPGVRVRLVDKNGEDVADGQEGQEISLSPAVFQGYLQQPELTERVLTKDGWVCSGDLCRRNADGTYSITGRIKDIIVRGGENISSLEVENILLQHPQIEEAAVVGMPDTRLQERICAFVVLKNSSKGMTFEEMFDFFLSQNVAKQKFPERLHVTGSLPKTQSGKVQKKELRQCIADILQAEHRSAPHASNIRS